MVWSNLLAYVNPTLDKNGVSWMIWIWLGIMVIATVVELFTMDMTSIWFAVGGLVCLILAAVPQIGWEVQLGVFFGVSIICMMALRPFAKKFLMKKIGTKTNIEAFEGKKIKMLTACENDTYGSAKLGDIVWTVKDDNGERLEAGEMVEVACIEGNKLVVRKIHAETEDVQSKLV